MPKKLSSLFVRLHLTIFFFAGLLINEALAQQKIGFYLPEGARRVEIPFERFSNLIVIPITINRMVTLKFVLDTGAETAILTEKLFGDILSLNYVREIDLQAPGIEDSLQAYVATGISLSLSGGIEAKNLNMLVLKDDYLELSKNLGEEIYGILGYDIFNRFIVSIDYDEGLITIYDPEFYRPRRADTAIPMEIIDAKPYIYINVTQNDKQNSLKLMVDTGASHSLLLDVSKSQNLQLPKKLIKTRLGKGLGGEIPGFLGRMSSCEFADLRFDDVLSSFPLPGAYIQAIKRGSRHGTLGGEILTRTKVTFDYNNEMMYVRKGSTYREPFEFNMSGMILNAEGKKLDSLIINRIMPHSPAANSGLREGDLILKINNMNLYNSSISEINALLRRKHGLKVVIIVARSNRKIKKVLRLKRMI